MKNTSIDSYFESSHGKLNEINNFNLWEQLSAYVFILTRILFRLFHIQLKAEACNFIKTENLVRVNSAKFLRTPFLTEHLR